MNTPSANSGPSAECGRGAAPIPAQANVSVRSESFLQNSRGTAIDRFGVWLSGRQIHRYVPTFEGKSLGDFGCDYTLELRWPDGTTQSFTPEQIGQNRLVTLTYPG